MPRLSGYFAARQSMPFLPYKTNCDRTHDSARNTSASNSTPRPHCPREFIATKAHCVKQKHNTVSSALNADCVVRKLKSS